jgi:hypothetical protein
MGGLEEQLLSASGKLQRGMRCLANVCKGPSSPVIERARCEYGASYLKAAVSHMRAVNWIMTANSIDRMPQTFLDRCTLVELPQPSVFQLAAKGRELLGAAMPNADVKGASHVLARQLSTANNHGKSMQLRRLKRLVDKLAEMQNRSRLH